MTNSMSHSCQVPDFVWEWAQQKSGHKVPSNFIRNVLTQAMFADRLAGTVSDVSEPADLFDDDSEKSLQARKTKLDLNDDDLFGDPEFTEAWKWIVEKADGNEERVISALENKSADGLENPRSFILSRYRNR